MPNILVVSSSSVKVAACPRNQLFQLVTHNPPSYPSELLPFCYYFLPNCFFPWTPGRPSGLLLVCCHQALGVRRYRPRFDRMDRTKRRYGDGHAEPILKDGAVNIDELNEELESKHLSGFWKTRVPFFVGNRKDDEYVAGVSHGSGTECILAR